MMCRGAPVTIHSQCLLQQQQCRVLGDMGVQQHGTPALQPLHQRPVSVLHHLQFTAGRLLQQTCGADQV